MPKREPVELGGETYSSISEASRKLGINRNTLVSRLKKAKKSNDVNVTIDHAVDDRKIIIEGKVFDSLSQAATFYSVNYATFVSRVRMGFKGAKLTASSPHRKNKAMIINGRSFNSVNAMIKATGISQTTYNRYIKLGLTPQESVEVLTHKRKVAPSTRKAA